jgi:hypothetical protein
VCTGRDAQEYAKGNVARRRHGFLRYPTIARGSRAGWPEDAFRAQCLRGAPMHFRIATATVAHRTAAATSLIGLQRADQGIDGPSPAV